MFENESVTVESMTVARKSPNSALAKEDIEGFGEFVIVSLVNFYLQTTAATSGILFSGQEVFPNIFDQNGY